MLFGIVVLVCVPGLTRVGQKLETASHTPSFSRNIDCPPKKVTVAPVESAAPAAPVRALETAPVARLAPPPDATRPRSPFLATPRPLRAPPFRLLA